MQQFNAPGHAVSNITQAYGGIGIFSNPRLLPAHEPQPASQIIDAEPYPFEFDRRRCALLIIDMQRDFLNSRRVCRRNAGQRRTRSCGGRSNPTASAGGVARGGLTVIQTRRAPARPDRPAAGETIRGRSKPASATSAPWGGYLVRGEDGA